MLTVFLHEIQAQMKSMRFQVSLLVLLSFFVANGVIYSLKIDRDVAETSRIDSELADQIGELAVLGDAVGTWYRLTARSTGTEFITEGGFNWFADAYWVNLQSGNKATEYGRSRTTNHWIRRFEIVDWTLIVRIGLSFLCVVMAYDMISGSHEQGVLRLTMANPLSRGAYLAGRFLAQLVMLMIAAVLGAAVSLLILVITDVIRLDASMARAIVLFFIGSSFYVAAFLLLSAGVSAWTRNSATSLVVLMLTWAVLTVVVPQTAYLYGMQTVDFDFDWNDEQWALRNETENALQQDGISLRELDRGIVDNFALERRFVREMADVEDQQQRIGAAALARELQQYEAARAINLVSPGYAFQYSVEALLGTGVARRQDFFRQAMQHREAMRQFVRGRDAQDPESPHVTFLGDYMSKKAFDSALMPHFRQTPLSMSDSVAAGLVPIVILILEVALAFFFAFTAFLRMELAGGS
ncbi:MAG: ABC transporter permease subunit [Gemmatimonadetes bacterium]|nr:ABC transporter permease subunit [Gemmatimonadota bacterium]